MKRNDYKKKRNLLSAAEALLVLVGTAAVWLLSGSLIAAAVTAVFLLAVCAAAFLQYRLDDRYISGVVEDLSRLCDNLITLEEKEIFPENEDTALSKLQNRILKLVKILRKKNATSLAEQENMKSLVSDLSHQLKTPITNLKMYSEILNDEGISESQRKEYAEILRQSVDRLIFLSESMIKISRLESGLIHLRPEVQSLNETVLVAVKNVFTKAKERDVEITYSGEAAEACHDRQWTAEAVFNLLDNAVKYSHSGAKVSVSVKRFGMFAAVEVADENEPIPEEERNKIFRRFYRGANSRNSEGIGIGLYLSREIAVKQGGYMNLKVSRTGNLFSVVLPLNGGTEARERGSQSADCMARNPSSKDMIR